MAVLTTPVQVGLEQVQAQEYPAGSVRFDWTIALLSAWIIGGVYLSGLAYFHAVDQGMLVFLRYAVPYSGGLVLLGYLIFNQWRNMSSGYDWRRALPKGYLLSLVAVVLGFMGGRT